MHFYTSININYLPKARILAKSVKQFCPGSKFSLIFSDVIPKAVDPAQEPFDEIITVMDLGIPVENIHLWIYEHSVVELCTAVKGQALVRFLENGIEKVVYLDPDIALFQNLDCLSQLLNEHDVVLTPHVTIPEETDLGIKDNEICALKHGTFNFGFFAVKNSENGLAFARWWRDRLIDFCYDNIPEGIFTDQRWGDLAPSLFDGVYLWKDAGCNVATWNISHRTITKKNEQFYVNGSPLKFYHFSGFDSGSQATMLDRYSEGNSALYELRQWYILRQKEEEQERYEKYPSAYNFYDNNEVITKAERELFRSRKDIIDYFAQTNPHVVNQERSYYHWYRDKSNHFQSLEEQLNEAVIAINNLQVQQDELNIELNKKQQEIDKQQDILERLNRSRVGWLIKGIVSEKNK